MSTPERKRERAAQLEEAALKLRREAEQKSKKQQPVSHLVELPALDKDGKVVKKRWKQWETCEHPDKPKTD